MHTASATHFPCTVCDHVALTPNLLAGHRHDEHSQSVNVKVPGIDVLHVKVSRDKDGQFICPIADCAAAPYTKANSLKKHVKVCKADEPRLRSIYVIQVSPSKQVYR
jgi:hypothetical protein